MRKLKSTIKNAFTDANSRRFSFLGDSGNIFSTYSHLFNKRGAWNKRGGGAKVAKSLNVELGINEEGGIFGKN